MARLFLIFFLLLSPLWASLPKGFSYVDVLIPNIEQELRYYSKNNFLGIRVHGYEGERAILSTRATKALALVQKELNSFNLGLKIFDAYRPQRAVDHFVRWAKDRDNTLMKASYYPNVEKKNLFSLGYIAKKSGHSRGSTVDLTIIDLDSKEALNMGSAFDFFGEQSHIFYPYLSSQEKANRLLLQSIMKKHGFNSLKEEWWHFTLKNEPFRKHYFDFLVQ